MFNIYPKYGNHRKPCPAKIRVLNRSNNLFQNKQKSELRSHVSCLFDVSNKFPLCWGYVLLTPPMSWDHCQDPLSATLPYRAQGFALRHSDHRPAVHLHMLNYFSDISIILVTSVVS